MGIETWALSHFISFYFLIFIYFEGEREREREKQSMSRGGAERERETQNLKRAPGSELSAQSPMRGLNSPAVRS